jgi:replicative DNA helicase
LANLKVIARKMAVVHRVDVIFVDYLQYVAESRSGMDRKDHVAEVSRGLKGLARRLDIPVVAAAQLRRDADGRIPTIGDFAESSGLEKDADAALLLHHKQDAGVEYSWIIAAKVRDGETGNVRVEFDKKHVRFKELVDSQESPW